MKRGTNDAVREAMRQILEFENECLKNGYKTYFNYAELKKSIVAAIENRQEGKTQMETALEYVENLKTLFEETKNV